MKIVDFDEEKSRKNGEITPKGLVGNLLEQVNDEEIEQIVYVIKYKNGQVSYGHTDLEQPTVLGLMECGKYLVIDSMYED